MQGARGKSMRLHLASVLAVQLLAVATTAARPTGGNEGGGGRLGQVTGGIDTATGSGGNRGGSTNQEEDRRYEGDLYRRRYEGEYVVTVDREGSVVRRTRVRPEPTGGPARVDLFLGIQKVVESDRSYSASLAFEDKWFRLAGAVSEYREEHMDGTKIAMTVPTLLLGARLTGPGPTRAFIEGGVAIARTKQDGVTGSNITGPIVGVHLEHQLRGPSLIGDAHVMVFEDGIKAYRGRVGVRVGFLELGVRVLDFNVGPALYGPEVGLSF
jgi:hypothetical protein